MKIVCLSISFIIPTSHCCPPATQRKSYPWYTPGSATQSSHRSHYHGKDLVSHVRSFVGVYGRLYSNACLSLSWSR
ncbi:hypothetical protein BDY19DRAFT_978222 [Irpex rosettiformis]|uniref:Uncharacterized protein n=1 Tax=Irpex rosettiformis TaxID=378272 RepID=A0ACB8TNG0_9APHY|nr:hypothetical protein BDY19DRAFT_978222 [Irpex rosettiformis]